ncbi:MAG: NAD(P)-dependent oxidoreductase [Gemmatimonadaceae bacterium]
MADRAIVATGGDAKPVVGFIGLGRMGFPMCQRLLAAGYSLVVYNRSMDKAGALGGDGATVASSPAELAMRSDIVMACLDTHAASEAVFLDDDGVVANARSGTLLIDHGTLSPAVVRTLANGARERKLDFLDAPVSGGPEGASNGTLAVMVGGAMAPFERALPVMRAYGSTVQRMGDVGSGTHAKLVNQLLTFVHGAVAAESIAMAQRAGLDVEALATVLRASFGHSRMLDRTLARVQAGNYDAGAALAHYAKDLKSVAQLADEMSMSLPVNDAARVLLAAAIARNLGHHDLAGMRLLYPDTDRARASSH